LGWRGTGDAVAALAGVRASNPLGAGAPYRSNRHLHHRLADPCRSAEGYAGEQAISVSVTSTPARPFRDEPEPWRAAALAGPTSTVRESRAGVEPACARVRSIRHLHHQRRLSRARRGKPDNKIGMSRRLERCAAIANPLRFALSSVSGSSPRSLRQAPRSWARAFQARAPGSGSPVPACAGMLWSYGPRFRTTKNPPERLAREGLQRRTVVSPLCEIGPMSRACVIDWR
jgi:hypothetical protein